MHHRIGRLLVAIMVLGLLVFASTASAMVLTTSGLIGDGSGDGIMGDQQPPDRIMKGDQQGCQGMMGGYQQGCQRMMEACHGMMEGREQNPVTPGTAVTGVTNLTIQNFTYQPSTVQVRVGSTLTWTNQDRAPHSVTFENGMADSGLLSQGQSFGYTFRTPGTYQYSCSIHPSMLATVTVVS